MRKKFLFRKKLSVVLASIVCMQYAAAQSSNSTALVVIPNVEAASATPAQSRAPTPQDILPSKGPLPITRVQSRAPTPQDILPSKGPLPITLAQSRAPTTLDMLNALPSKGSLPSTSGQNPGVRDLWLYKLGEYAYKSVYGYIFETQNPTTETPEQNADSQDSGYRGQRGSGGGAPDPGITNHRVEANNDRFNQLQSDMQKNDKKAMRGIAAIAAMGNAVFPSAPGKTVVGGGIGSYDGVQAFAITVSHRPEKLSQMSFQGGIASSAGGKPVMRVGASYEF